MRTQQLFMAKCLSPTTRPSLIVGLFELRMHLPLPVFGAQRPGYLRARVMMATASARLAWLPGLKVLSG